MLTLVRRSAAAVVAAFVFGSLSGTAWSAEQIVFDGFVHFCSSGPPDEVKVTPGGTVHIRSNNVNQWAASNVYIDGIERNVALVNVTPQRVNAHLKATLEPFAFNGTWKIVQTVHVDQDGNAFGHGVGHGTGELHGMTIKFTTGPEVLVGNPCSDLPSALLSGVIIVP